MKKTEITKVTFCEGFLQKKENGKTENVEKLRLTGKRK